MIQISLLLRLNSEFSKDITSTEDISMRLYTTSVADAKCGLDFVSKKEGFVIELYAPASHKRVNLTHTI